MILSMNRSVVLAFVMAAVATVGSGCYADAEGPVYAEGYQGQDAPPPQAPQPQYAEVYQPQYYNGSTVYYNDGGLPYYYNGVGFAYVPYTSPYYAGYLGHYRTYAPAYRRWYAGGGYRYPVYRGGAYHGGVYRGGGYRGGAYHGGGVRGGGFHGGRHR
jgi:hypothetical protein